MERIEGKADKAYNHFSEMRKELNWYNLDDKKKLDDAFEPLRDMWKEMENIENNLSLLLENTVLKIDETQCLIKYVDDGDVVFEVREFYN